MKVQKILVVDDSATQRHSIGEILKQRGYDVTFVEDGESGIEYARANLPDLVIMDVVMPKMNGFQATRALSSDLSTQHIPVILCTTKDQETDKVWGIRQGARGYVLKPIKAADLLSQIDALTG